MSSVSPHWSHSLFPLNDLVEEEILSSGKGAFYRFLVAGSETMGTDWNTGHPSGHQKTLFHSEGDSTGTACPGTLWGRNIQKPFDYGPGQLAVDVPAWMEEFKADERSFPTSTLLSFCDHLAAGWVYNWCILLFRPLHRKMCIKWDIINFSICVVSLLSAALQFDMTFYQLQLYIIRVTLCHYLVFGFFPLLLFR